MKVCELIDFLEKEDRTQEHLFRKEEEAAIDVFVRSDSSRLSISYQLHALTRRYGPIREIVQKADNMDPLNQISVVIFQSGDQIQFHF